MLTTYQNAQLPNPIGSTVSIDPKIIKGLCQTGLHIADENFAITFGDGPVAIVEVNPRHIYDTSSTIGKAVVSKYKVIALCERKTPLPIIPHTARF